MAYMHDTGSGNGISSQFVTFALGEQTYGISILKLNEIIAYQQLTTIPNLPGFIKGVLNLRGEVIPVIDLRERFNMEPKAYDQLTVIIVLEIAGQTMSVVVDSVSDVITLQNDAIKPRPNFSTGIQTDFIHGMGIKDNKFIILLDVEKVLAAEDISTLKRLGTQKKGFIEKTA
ncbi:MAG: purine-binding chemotaxis protein CheW [Deltaproteobacteria bacterium]|nr:purine-binding chemotaxis protein CheW [Deltaproteobacteria bacterium]